MKTKTISEIYGWPLDSDPSHQSDWLVQDVNWALATTPDKAGAKEVGLFLRQSLVLDFAIPKAVEILRSNPMAGDLYDGELLRSLATSKLDLLKFRDGIKELTTSLESFAKNHNFDCEENKSEYLSWISKLEEANA